MAVTTGPGDFELTLDELRVVARFAMESALMTLHVFEAVRPEDHRPRAAIEAARAFVDGGARTNLQRTTAIDAHRAAKEVADEAAQHAARAAGDAAAAAYLHPLAKATQVGHVLGAAAHAARAVELIAGDDPEAGAAFIEQARLRATPVLIDVLTRYPLAPSGTGRSGLLMKSLDSSLRLPR